MKIKVEYSESIQVEERVWRKWGCEIEQESDTTETADILKAVINEKVLRWHKESQPEMTTKSWLEPILNPHNSVIDRSIERLEILIDDCKTKSDLYRIEDEYGAKIHSTQSLSTLFKSKLEELSK